MALDGFLQAAGARANTEVEPRHLSGARYGAGHAAALLKPATAAQAAELLQLAQAHQVPLVLQGAHTGLVKAGTPAGQVLLSTERLREVFEFDPLDRTLRVSAGFKLSEVNQRLGEHGLQFPIDLSADPSIGGMLAHNTGGTRMLRYGDVRANTLGLEVALADGQLLRLGKGLAKDNSALALQHLFIGASGGLGLITEATLKLAPLPKQSAVALVAPASLDAVWPLYQRWTAEFGQLISAFEGLSANALEAAIHVQGGASPFATELPPYSLLIELSADLPPAQLSLRELLHTALEAAFESGEVVDAALDKDEALWALRHAVSEGLREQGAVIGFDISLPRCKVWAFREQASAFLAAHFAPAKVCDFGHLGDGGQHFNLVWPKSVPALSAEDGLRLRDGIYALVAAHGGSFSAEHGLGPLLQRTYAAHTAAGVRQVSGALEAVLNPAGLLGQFRFA